MARQSDYAKREQTIRNFTCTCNCPPIWWYAIIIMQSNTDLIINKNTTWFRRRKCSSYTHLRKSSVLIVFKFCKLHSMQNDISYVVYENFHCTTIIFSSLVIRWRPEISQTSYSCAPQATTYLIWPVLMDWLKVGKSDPSNYSLLFHIINMTVITLATYLWRSIGRCLLRLCTIYNPRQSMRQ